MKKVFALLLFIGFLAFSHAQDRKPSKEETVAFVQRILETGLGKGSANRGIGSEVAFLYETYTTKFVTEIGRAVYRTDYYEKIKWEYFSKFNELSERDNAKEIEVIFSQPVKHKLLIRGGGETESFDYEIIFNVPLDKIESIKKAFLRLAEIAKEENKDPFAN